MDEPTYPGTFTALTSGYFVYLRNLVPSMYTIRFGGKGMGNFFTDAIYEITIKGKGILKNDISVQNTSPNALLKENKIAIRGREDH